MDVPLNITQMFLNFIIQDPSVPMSLKASFQPLFVLTKWQQSPMASLMLRYSKLVGDLVEARSDVLVSPETTINVLVCRGMTGSVQIQNGLLRIQVGLLRSPKHTPPKKTKKKTPRRANCSLSHTLKFVFPNLVAAISVVQAVPTCKVNHLTVKTALLGFGKVHPQLCGYPKEEEEQICNHISLSFRILLSHFRKCRLVPQCWLTVVSLVYVQEPESRDATAMCNVIPIANRHGL